MNYTLTIERDEDPMNPRTEWDNVGEMVCWHRNYLLGDVQETQDPAAWLRELAGSLVKADDVDLIPDEHIRRILEKHLVILPLYLHDHGCGGITMSTGAFSCPWDSGQVGYIYCILADVDREWAGDREKALAYLKGEVETYNQYLTCDVWRYVIEDANGESVDSCCGFFGYEYAEEEGQSALDYYVRLDRAEYAARYAATVGYLPAMQEADA